MLLEEVFQVAAVVAERSEVAGEHNQRYGYQGGMPAAIVRPGVGAEAGIEAAHAGSCAAAAVAIVVVIFGLGTGAKGEYGRLGFGMPVPSVMKQMRHSNLEPSEASL